VDHSKKTPLDYAVANKHQGILDFEKKLTTTLYSANAGTSKPNPKGNKVTVDDFEYIMNLGRGAFGEVVLVQKKEDDG
jgi:hypothetical protein